ncbi:MAG: bifunctional DNA primase/polymerase [Candidatus Paceibacterota bacterium]|jgi:hypothetical protein
MSEFLNAALYYAGLGWAVFPLLPGQKVPITKHGVNDATTDVQQITEWWTKWPNANIALACGSVSGVYVVDVDVREEKNIDGFNSLKEFPRLPDTVQQNTPSGGSHYLYSSAVPPANRNSFRPGIDIRGNGYYIVVAPSVHPNGKRYEWGFGSGPWNRQVVEYPDFLRPGQRPVPRVTICTTPLVSTDISARASAYLDTCDIAIQGQGGHDKLLWASVVLTQGFLLSDSQAFDLLSRVYNPKCIPPWDLSDPKDERDFRRKITESRKLVPQSTPGWLLEEKQPGCTVDIMKFIGQDVPEFKPDEDGYCQDKELSYLCSPTGLLGELCSWLNCTSFKEHPFLSLAASLAFLGVLFGRKVKDRLGSRTNIYCMGIAKSSAGKNHALQQLRKLATKADCYHLIGGSSIASDASLEIRMARQPATLYLWDEIAHLLSHVKSGKDKNFGQTVSTLMQFYSSAESTYLGKEYAEDGKQKMIVQPCCCIYGAAIPEHFTNCISEMELHDGWLSRCLVFQSREDAPLRQDRSESDIPERLIAEVKRWAKRVIPPKYKPEKSLEDNCSAAPEQMLIPASDEAEKVFVDFYEECTRNGKDEPRFAALWDKGIQNARRIALIVASGDEYETPHITKENASYACRLIRYIINDFIKEIASEIVSGSIETNKRKIISVVKKAGIKGIEKCDLTKKTPWFIKKSRNDILDDLLESCEIVAEMKDRVVRYWTIDNYRKHVECKTNQ